MLNVSSSIFDVGCSCFMKPLQPNQTLLIGHIEFSAVLIWIPNQIFVLLQEFFSLLDKIHLRVDSDSWNCLANWTFVIPTLSSQSSIIFTFSCSIWCFRFDDILLCLLRIRTGMISYTQPWILYTRTPASPKEWERVAIEWFVSHMTTDGRDKRVIQLPH